MAAPSLDCKRLDLFQCHLLREAFPEPLKWPLTQSRTISLALKNDELVLGIQATFFKPSPEGMFTDLREKNKDARETWSSCGRIARLGLDPKPGCVP